MSTIDTRREQMFPKLTSGEIARLRRFGEIRRYAAGAQLFKTGEPSPGMFVIISGTVAVSRRDGLGHVVPIIELGPGEFLAEVGQLSGQPALVDGAAKTDRRSDSHSDRRPARAVGRRSRARRAHDARAHPPPRSPDRNGCWWPGTGRSGDQPRCDTPAGLPHAQRLSPSGARPGGGRRSEGVDRALRTRTRPPAACRVPGRDRAQEPKRGGAGALARHGARRCAGPDLRRCHRRCGTGWSLHRRLCRIGGPLRHRVRCAARSAGRRRQALASRTIWDSRPAYQARRWPAAPSCRRRSSGPRW